MSEMAVQASLTL